MMNELTELINAFSRLDINEWTIVLALIIVVGIALLKFLDDKKFNKYYDDMKNEKNKEIERLADDNRRYRDIYLLNLGVSSEQIKELSGNVIKGD